MIITDKYQAGDEVIYKNRTWTVRSDLGNQVMIFDGMEPKTVKKNKVTRKESKR